MTIGVIIFTYNRPHMLLEALASARRNRPDKIIICDDGSDPAVPYMGEDVTIMRLPSRTPEERIAKNMSGHLGNLARSLIGTDYIAWLCDDDLMAAGWLDYVRKQPLAPLYIGGVNIFKDDVLTGKDWKDIDHSPSEMTTGNWVERTDLSVRWGNYAFSGDARYVWELLNVCGQKNVLKPPSNLPYDPWAAADEMTANEIVMQWVHPRLALHYRNHELTLGNLLKAGKAGEQFKKGTME